jgi:Zn-dependent peptidase ImmA (M78 family)
MGQDADRFAAELIMPHSFLLRAFGNDLIDIDDSELVTRLAREFKVSTDAMKIRMTNLFAFL